MDNDSTLFWDAATLPPKWVAWLLVLLAGSTILGIGAARTDDSIWGYGGTPTDAFWEMKVRYSNPQCNTLLIGNSRVLRGLDPSVFEQQLPDTTCFNYGFPALRFGSEYLDHVTAIIDQSEHPPVRLIIGISGTSFLPIREKDQFLTALRDSERRSGIRFPGLHRISHERHLASRSDEGRDENYVQVAHRNGWVASDFLTPDPDLAPARFRGRKHIIPITPDRWRPFIRRVRQWSRAGVAVYGFTAPTSPEMQTLQNEKFPFDQKQFVTDFKGAGGIWIPVDPANYDTFDGSHVTSDAARNLSKDIANAILEIERGEGPAE